jgi:hypothetical protein
VAIQQIIRQLAIAALCGWFSVGVAFANIDTGEAKELTEDEVTSFGCVVGGTGLFAAGYAAGPSEAIMLWGGGLLVPSGSAVLAVSMLGGLGWAGCSMGATLAPTVVWFSEQWGRLVSYTMNSITSIVK